MLRPPPSAAKSRGFTLTELLVVLLLLSILLAILVPSLGFVREQGKATRCLGNVQQVGKILLLYSAENNGIIPAPSILQPPNYTSGITWNSTLDQLGYLRKETYTGLKTGIMSCPSRPQPGTHVYNNMHYGVSRNVGFDCIGFANRPPLRTSRIERPSCTMLLGEVKKDYMIQTTSDALMENIVYPHNSQATIFFYDGHAESVQGPWARPVVGASAPFY